MKSHIFLLSLLFCYLLFSSFLMDLTVATPGEALCGKLCRRRCAKAGLKRRCMKFCRICCGKCRCVPSGTYGNKHQCPCYRDIRTPRGKPKCP